jgi:hypothetical protein
VPVFRWSALKSERLKKARGVSFEEILEGEVVETIDHPARAGQKIMLIWYRYYIWAVPFIEAGDSMFLKTLYPCRKYTKMFKKRGPQ